MRRPDHHLSHISMFTPKCTPHSSIQTLSLTHTNTHGQRGVTEAQELGAGADAEGPCEP